MTVNHVQKFKVVWSWERISTLCQWIWAWGHFELSKSPLYMGMGTLCIAKKPRLMMGRLSDAIPC